MSLYSEDLITRKQHTDIIRVLAAERNEAQAERDKLREALERIAFPDGDEAAFYDWSVAEKIARAALVDPKSDKDGPDA